MPSPNEFMIPWNSEEGKRRLFESEYTKAFFALAHLFEHQIKPTYCGIACSVIVLNALKSSRQSLNLGNEPDVEVPNGNHRIKPNYYNQLTFLDDESNKIKNKKVIEGEKHVFSNGELQDFNLGLNLTDLEKILRLHTSDVNCIHAQDSSVKDIEGFRRDVIANVTSTQSFIIANFDGSEFNRAGAGHFSPIAGYHPETDSCLILDVNGCSQPWFWISLEKFYQSMCTLDKTCNRGYLIVSDCLDNQ
ncbi:MAG: phytochelatin synthase family protein [Rickettsiales bacterium]